MAVDISLDRPEVLDASVWQARRAAHTDRVDDWVQPHLARRRVHVPHPVEDFLFTYYSNSPAALRRWHPGFGTVLQGAEEEYAGQRGYRAPGSGTATVGVELLASRRVLVTTLRTLLAATAARPAQLGCFGMHEWAMVYRQPEDEVRHAAWPLRLGGPGTDAVVDSQRVACSHFDAFRFFTEPARPLNVLQPRSDDRADLEQPGCLHAGMDLYKHAYRLSPLVASELVADCFALARDIRVLDMRASPYDFGGLGHDPVRIETAEGRRDYADQQRGFAERGAPLRRRLLEECVRLLAALDASPADGSPA